MDTAEEEEQLSENEADVLFVPLHPRGRHREGNFFDNDENYTKFILKSKYLRFDLLGSKFQSSVDEEDRKILNLVFQDFKLNIPTPNDHDSLTLTFQSDPRKLVVSSTFVSFHSSTIREILSSSMSVEAKEGMIHFDTVSRRDFELLVGFLYDPGKLVEYAHILLRTGILEGLLLTSRFLGVTTFKSLFDMAIVDIIKAHDVLETFIDRTEFPSPEGDPEVIGEHAIIKLEYLFEIIDQFQMTRSVEYVLKAIFKTKEEVFITREPLQKMLTTPGRTSQEASILFAKVLLGLLDEEEVHSGIRRSRSIKYGY